MARRTDTLQPARASQHRRLIGCRGERNKSIIANAS
jgi:hypothetical protein